MSLSTAGPPVQLVHYRPSFPTSHGRVKRARGEETVSPVATFARPDTVTPGDRNQTGKGLKKQIVFPQRGERQKMKQRKVPLAPTPPSAPFGGKCTPTMDRPVTQYRVGSQGGQWHGTRT
jgi:hypothetical protein